MGNKVIIDKLTVKSGYAGGSDRSMKVLLMVYSGAGPGDWDDYPDSHLVLRINALLAERSAT